MSKEETFEEALENNIYFTLRGCKEKGNIKIPRTMFNFISNISGMCTDKCETEDFFKNPRTMYVALNLIYLAFDKIRQESERAISEKKNREH